MWSQSTPKSRILKIQQVDKKKFWDYIWTPRIILRRLVPSKVEMDHFETFSYINVWVKFDPYFSYLISHLNFLYIFDDVITNFWHPFWNASRHPYTKILVWACSLDSLDAFWYPRLVVWPTKSDIMEFAVILILESSSHIYYVYVLNLLTG